MVGKILTLFDIEFKQIQRVFFTVLSVLVFSNTALFAYIFYTNVKKTELHIGMGQGISVLKSDLARKVFKSFGVAEFIYSLSLGIMILALIWCIFYGIRIWNKDFSDKSKSIYTLFMLPESKFIIFLSKLLTMVVLFYGVILVQHICWGVEGFILNKLTGFTIREMINSINYSNSSIGIITTYPIYPVEFFVIYIVGPIAFISVLFTGVILSKSMRRFGGFLGIIYFMILMIIYFADTMLYYTYSDILLSRNIVFHIVVTGISMIISYILLQKRVYA